MSRATYRRCKVCEGIHEVGAWPSACVLHWSRGPRSHLSAPNIRPDGMGATWCPVDGQTYDSKSAYYGAVKASGGEIIGNETTPSRAPVYEPKGIEQSIKDVLDGYRGE